MIKLLIDLPYINPIALQLGPISIHWYGLMYLLGFGLIYLALSRSALKLSKAVLGDYIFAAALGVIIGGRIGYILFYNFAYYWREPFQALMIWQGGMSFHGGLLGVIIATVIFCKRQHISFWYITDTMLIFLPFTLALGRIGNFINGELYGRVSDLPWAMHFYTAEGYRHPSQIYEAILHIIFGILLFSQKKLTKYPAVISGLFLIGYGIIRILVECFRQPDAQIGFIFQYITLGQLLSIPLIVSGAYLLFYHRSNSK